MTTIGPGIFRLFLSYLVVLHHSFPLRLGAWAVYVFFILSGFWICRMWRRRYAHTRNPYLTFVVSRWWRLAPIFLVCTILGVVSSVLLQGTDALQRVGNLSWWLRQIPIAGSTGVGTVLPPAWSLDVEMQFYFLAPLLVLLLARMGPLLRYLTVASALGWFLFCIFRGGYSQVAHLSLYLGFFLVGVAIEIAHWTPSRGLAFGSVLVFFLVTLALTLWPQTHRGIWVIGRETQANAENSLSHLVGLWWVVGAVVVSPFVAWNVSQVSPSFDRFLGNLAYPLYLFHWIPRDWYYHLSLTAGANWKQSALLIANFLLASLGALLIFCLIDQPLDRRRAVWVDSRKNKIKPPIEERVLASN
jgi:peptidoglycan/LPS O-acetylase OafA/YrhL